MADIWKEMWIIFQYFLKNSLLSLSIWGEISENIVCRWVLTSRKTIPLWIQSLCGRTSLVMESNAPWVAGDVWDNMKSLCRKSFRSSRCPLSPMTPAAVYIAKSSLAWIVLAKVRAEKMHAQWVFIPCWRHKNFDWGFSPKGKFINKPNMQCFGFKIGRYLYICQSISFW